MAPVRTLTSIIDNQGDNTLAGALERITADGYELWIASAYFSLDAFDLLGERLTQFDRIKLVFGGDAALHQRKALLDAMRRSSEADLLTQREKDPLLMGLKRVNEFIQAGKLQARVYTKDRFHAKAYVAHKTGHPPIAGILGSGNFTRSGLTQNVELNAHLSIDQAVQLEAWFEQIWDEAEQDDVTDELSREIEKHIKLYEPHSIYLRTLLEWGDWMQGREALPPSIMLRKLDPHQEDGYRQALNLISREGGAMICDGVGLGKSYIALALIENALRNGESVLLLAPRAILDSSWDYYLRQFLGRYTKGFDTLKQLPITWFGFKPKPTEEERLKAEAKHMPLPEPTPEDQDKYESLDIWSEQAQFVVIDESHNLRRTDSNRYINALRMLAPQHLGKKKVVLLTATPLNTDYTDVTAQLRLICLEGGKIGALPIKELQYEAANADREMRKDPEKQPSLFEPDVPNLKAAMHTVAIQRSRATCKELARSRGMELRFPERDGLHQIHYTLSPLYIALVEKAQKDFEELAQFIKKYRAEIGRAAAAGSSNLRKSSLVLPKEGLRFSAYLPERYRREAAETLRDAQVESFLVMLVFTNVMKQLESSIAAFEGILKALGAGLCARLHFVFGDQVDAVLTEHLEWVQGAVRHMDVDDEAFEYDPAGLTEQDEHYLEDLKKSLHIAKGLADFSHETHDTRTWRAHIESDLRKLREIHSYAVAARDHGEDKKLADVAAQIREQRAMGRKVLVFTQSVRTADHLYSKLPGLLKGERVERITAGVQGERRTRLLHEFSPRYNPVKQAPLELQELGVLISTDVLSEGVNLQEAGCILNYDLHWNPVRLIQRIGRVDRRLRDDDPGHTFSIFNVIPPHEIEKIIDLVGTVEGRKRKILTLLGLDQSFFSAEDEAGTLEEFNRMVEGDVGPQDRVLSRYVDIVSNHPESVKESDAAPRGAFGVWGNAPIPGAIGVFRVTLRPNASETDREGFAPLLRKPILVLKTDSLSFDAPAILDLLSQTEPNEQSANPASIDNLPAMLADLRRAALGSLPGRTQAVTVELVCWMELQTGGSAHG